MPQRAKGTRGRKGEELLWMVSGPAGLLPFYGAARKRIALKRAIPQGIPAHCRIVRVAVKPLNSYVAKMYDKKEMGQ